jgi:hypothetical protein
MNTITPHNDSSVAAVFRQLVLPMFPAALQSEMERELPILALQAHQVGVAVLLAEGQGLRFSDAVKRPEFLVMGRIYFGASNLLQWQLPLFVQKVLRDVLHRTVDGDFEPARRLLFAIASRKDDAEAALWRFLLWVAVRFNLLVLTWHDPGVEARGSLLDVEDQAETTLRELLGNTSADVLVPDVRPLHVLMADVLLELALYDQMVADGLVQVQSELKEVLVNAEALEKIRGMDARTAAMFHPGPCEEGLGSQQIADRYPQWFPSANALDQGRSRVLRRRTKVVPQNDRFIDVVLDVMGNGQ